MKIFKTFFVIVLCTMFLFCFTACANNGTTVSEDPQNITDTIEDTNSGVVEVIDSAIQTTQPVNMNEPAAATQEPAATPQQAKPVTQQYAGTVKEITQEDGLYSYTISVFNGTTDEEIIAAQNEDTIIVNAQTGAPVAADAIKEGDAVIVYLSMMTTRSIPPISQAYCIITDIPTSSLGIPTYVEVKQAQINENGDLVVLNQNQDLYVTVPADVEIGISGEDGEVVPFNQIQEGTQLLMWFDAVMESYPAQAVADSCVMCV